MDIDDLTGTTIGFLASGGLDSCTITRWLTDRGLRVVTFTADLGQADESLDVIAERMRGSGAVEAVVVDLRAEMADAGLGAVHAQAKYEGGYWNTTPLGRYVTVRGVLPLLADHGIGVLAHGATGRGNDQVRFQLITNMLRPDVEVYAPWRDPKFLADFGGREEMLDFCAERGVPIRPPSVSKYSTDANLLGLTHEAGELESLGTPASFVEPEMGVRAIDAPNLPERVTIEFSKGVPVTINGNAVLDAVDFFERCNLIAGRNAVGIASHLVENRFVGTKSRGVYEAPGVTLLGAAYAHVLELVLDRRARRLFEHTSGFYAEQLYQGYGLDLGSQIAVGVFAGFAELATATITLELYKGSVSFVASEDVPHSLYVEEDASMSAVGDFDHADSEGFLRVLGIGAKATARSGQSRRAWGR